MDRWSFNIDACFNIFMTVAYDENGRWEIREAKGKPGDYMVMKALMPQIVAISNCPIRFNTCNNFRLKPLTPRASELSGAPMASQIADGKGLPLAPGGYLPRQRQRPMTQADSRRGGLCILDICEPA
jgi:hypothetical protein